MSASISVLKLHIARPWSPTIARARPNHVHFGGSSCSSPSPPGHIWGFGGAIPLRTQRSISGHASATTGTVYSMASMDQILEVERAVSAEYIQNHSATCHVPDEPPHIAVSDLDVATVNLSEFVLTGAKVTSVAHGVWRKVVRPGDTVIDATCGNGHDTLELARLVCADNAPGYVYAFDVQEDALANSSYLLDERLDSVQRKRVKLLRLCHSQLEKIVGETAIRLVTFNLGYLPGGDHTVVTNVDTTIRALQVSSNVLQPGGLISVVAYVGHPGGREEFEAVMNFAANLPSHAWVCSQHEWVNRPLSPRLILMLKK